MKKIQAVVTMGIMAMMAAGCGAATEGQTEVDDEQETQQTPTPAPTATPAPAAKAQLKPVNLRGVTATGIDGYEPNDTAPYYLGAGTAYTVNGYIDPVDASWTVDVVNEGAPVSGSFEVRLTAGAVTMVQNVEGLATGETKSVSFVMSDVNPGTISATVEVDTRNDVDEEAEDDNVHAAVELAVAGDVDQFSVYQFSGRALGITLENLPADYDIQLLTPNGTVFASSSNGNLTTETINTTANQSGAWIVKIVGWQGARSGAYPYRLKISAP